MLKGSEEKLDRKTLSVEWRGTDTVTYRIGSDLQIGNGRGMPYRALYVKNQGL